MDFFRIWHLALTKHTLVKLARESFYRGCGFYVNQMTVFMFIQKKRFQKIAFNLNKHSLVTGVDFVVVAFVQAK